MPLVLPVKAEPSGFRYPDGSAFTGVLHRRGAVDVDDPGEPAIVFIERVELVSGVVINQGTRFNVGADSRRKHQCLDKFEVPRERVVGEFPGVPVLADDPE
jgi:hypothetical protein